MPKLPPLPPDHIIAANLDAATTPHARQRWADAAAYSARRHDSRQHTDPRHGARVRRILGVAVGLGGTEATEAEARQRREWEDGDKEGFARWLGFDWWVAALDLS